MERMSRMEDDGDSNSRMKEMVVRGAILEDVISRIVLFEDEGCQVRSVHRNYNINRISVNEETGLLGVICALGRYAL